MHTLQPLKNKLKRELARARNDINDVLDIIENDKQSDKLTDDIAEDVAKLFDKIERLKQATSRSVYRGRELSESLPQMADGLADSILQIDHLEILRRLEYIELAEFLATIHPDLLDATLTELASIEGGKEKLILIYKILRDDMSSKIKELGELGGR